MPVALPVAPLPWQTGQWQRLETLVQDDRLPHAILVSGSEGSGKEHFLFALARRLFCERPAASACGECRPCHLFGVGSHPDFMRVGVAEDKRQIAVDQVREMIEFSGMTPSLGGLKVILLGPAEAMNTSTANALLKCLEEPSRSTVLLLYSHEPGQLPATVRSRCQVYAFPPPNRGAVLEWLNLYTGDGETSERLLAACGNRPLLARDVYLQDGMEARLGLVKALQALQSGQLSAVEFTRATKAFELEELLDLVQQRVEEFLRERVLAGLGDILQPGFELRDDVARLKRAVSRGATPNRELCMEDIAARMVRVVGECNG